MARGLNKVMIIGHLGEEPKVRYTPSGTAVAAFSVATSDTWKDKQSGEQKERTDWHRCEAWGRLGEVCGQYLGKGSKVYVEGSIRYEQWEDKESKEKRYSTKIRVEEMQMLDGQRKAGAPTAPPSDAASSKQQEAFGDDIPF